MSEEAQAKLTHRQTLNDSATLTLAERVQQFNEDSENDGEPPLSIYKLRKIYDKHKVKRKKLLRAAGNPKKYSAKAL